jgi:hypothetical protein
MRESTLRVAAEGAGGGGGWQVSRTPGARRDVRAAAAEAAPQPACMSVKSSMLRASVGESGQGVGRAGLAMRALLRLRTPARLSAARCAEAAACAGRALWSQESGCDRVLCCSRVLFRLPSVELLQDPAVLAAYALYKLVSTHISNYLHCCCQVWRVTQACTIAVSSSCPEVQCSSSCSTWLLSSTPVATTADNVRLIISA